MNLSMTLIAMYMKKYEPECHILNDSLSIKGVRFFAEKQPLGSHEYVYLGPARAYFQDPRYEDALLLANDSSQIICRGAEYEELLNDVLSAFDFYNSFEQRLLVAASVRKPLSEIIKIIEEIITWPYFIFDIDGHLIGQCNPSVPVYGSFARVRNKRFLGFDTISMDFFDRNGNISTDLTAFPQLLSPSNEPDTCAVSQYFSQDGENLGFTLIVPENNEQINASMQLSLMLAKFFPLCAEFTEKSSVYQSDHSILLQLLKGEPVPDAVINKFMFHAQFSCSPILAAYRSGSIRNYTLSKMLLTELEGSSANCIACNYDNLTVVLTDEKNLPSILSFIEQRVSSGMYQIGISLPVLKPEQINIALKQCLFTLNSEDYSGVRYCRNLALPYLIQKLKETDMASSLKHPAINLLETYDEENNSELLKTLRVYIECELNQSRAAKELSVHLNTLKYRLRKICELSGIRLDDYNELFYIQISLAI